jgi:hypothetical protein
MPSRKSVGCARRCGGSRSGFAISTRSRDLPAFEEEYALMGRSRVRRALDLPPDHYDVLARETLDARRARWTDDGN